MIVLTAACDAESQMQKHVRLAPVCKLWAVSTAILMPRQGTIQAVAALEKKGQKHCSREQWGPAKGEIAVPQCN